LLKEFITGSICAVSDVDGPADIYDVESDSDTYTVLDQSMMLTDASMPCTTIPWLCGESETSLAPQLLGDGVAPELAVARTASIIEDA
jgi:hypothetical protein